MAIARRAAGSGLAGSASFTTSPNANDYILLWLVNSAALTPGIPSGYTSIAAGLDSANGLGVRLVGKVATGGETMPSVTNTTVIAWAIYSGVNTTTPVSNAGGQQGNSASISYAGIVTMAQVGGAGTSWVIYTVGANQSTSQLYNAAPNSTSLVAGTSNFWAGPPPYETAIFDTNAPVSSASFNSKTLAATTPWFSKTIELNAAVGGGPATPTNLFFF